MIINGGSRRARGFWAKHLQRIDTNERVYAVEFRGLLHTTIADALREMEAIAQGTRCKNFMYHASLNPCPGESLTPEQWHQAIDTLEKNLGYEGLPRVVVEHEKAGRTHRHVVWSRIDPDTLTARSDSLNYAAHERTARELESAFGLKRGRSVLMPDREVARPERRPKAWEVFRGQESGMTPQQVATQVRELYAQANSGQGFAAALDAAGFILCRGDKRGYCLLDQAGHDHSLTRRLGVKSTALRAFLRDIDLNSLPSIAEARAGYRAGKQRTQHHTRQLPRLVLTLPKTQLPEDTAAAINRQAKDEARCISRVLYQDWQRQWRAVWRQIEDAVTKHQAYNTARIEEMRKTQAGLRAEMQRDTPDRPARVMAWLRLFWQF